MADMSLAPRASELREVATAHGQGHLFRWWDDLGPAERETLLAQIASLDFPRLQSLAEELILTPGAEAPTQLEPSPVIPVPRTPETLEEARAARAKGEELLRAGKVAPLVVAGGQGTRLGFAGPKGAYGIGPLTGKPLFAFFAEKIRATEEHYGAPMTWYIMTSPVNDGDTRAFFETNRFFGMSPERVVFFAQGTLPALDRTGKILLSSPHELALSPDGHGGTLGALVRSGALDRMEREGVETISYFQVDNVLVKVLDPVFIGYHAAAGAEMSSKVVRKAYPEEKVGVIGLRNGKLGVIEYSDLREEDMFARGPDGELLYWAGSIAIHLLEVGFIRRLERMGLRLPFHRADKKVPHVDGSGQRVDPEEPNGVKLESFIFDALEFAANPLTMEVERQEEFSPVKNAEGVDSPASARRDMMSLFARWLEQAGAVVPRTPDGELAVKIEISPLYALEASDLEGRIPPGQKVTGDLLLEDRASPS